MESIKIFGVRVDKVSLKEAVCKVEEFLQGNGPKTIYTPNTEIIMEAKEDEQLKEVLNNGNLIIPDGIGLIYAAKIKKKPLVERVTGFDLSIEMIKLADKHSYSIFLLGGEEGIAKKAGEKIVEKYTNVKIAGYNNGYFKGAHIGFPGHEEEREVIEKIKQAKPDILFVGFGAPKSEKWMELYKDELNCKVMIGNGGTMDIIAGKVKRAPEVYQKLGLEWFYRLIKEPSRIKRQIALPKFMFKVIFGKDVVE
ncbi:WecB/TagA/CpsF family glycosyltransferase [Anaerosalibacter sp. Marseille-P3206]|uniref:WecB/TagA/CpsF family glycosyltransferase n=1 Tax=Anaerosalibacter sp. Marseille-P3206 TaxID=1871005 RepID=UPI000984BBFB|nr:WecB/TagA/CpsF family glycosyltransferase [Anaerosalibacter sp. Marseille-P3206]